MSLYTGCMGDTQYHIKLRCSGPGDGGTSLQHSRDHIGAPLVLTVRNDCLSVSTLSPSHLSPSPLSLSHPPHSLMTVIIMDLYISDKLKIPILREDISKNQ